MTRGAYVLLLHNNKPHSGPYWVTPRTQIFFCGLALIMFPTYNKMDKLFLLFVHVLEVIPIRPHFIKQRLLHKIELAGGIFF